MIPIVSPTHSGNWREPGHALLCLISTHPSSTHPIHPNRSQPFLHSCQILNSTSRVDWFVCTMVFLVPSPPTISSTHPIPPGRSQPFLCLHQVLTLHQSLLWMALSPSSPNTLFANPPSQSLHNALACQIYGLCYRWFGCSFNVSFQ